MTTTFKAQVSSYQDFVPRGLPTIQVQCNESNSPSVRNSYQTSQNPFKCGATNNSAGFGDFSSQMLSVATTQQPTLNSRQSSYH